MIRTFRPRDAHAHARGVVVAVLALAAILAGAVPVTAGAASKVPLIRVIGAENQYANVLAQIGGKYVSV